MCTVTEVWVEWAALRVVAASSVTAVADLDTALPSTACIAKELASVASAMVLARTSTILTLLHLNAALFYNLVVLRSVRKQMCHFQVK